jgi:hypothetical protein
MTKEFIPYEQALELKKIGFDEDCFKYWVQTYNDTHTWMDLHNKALNDDDCKAPLFQQAFRWFRDKYGYNGIVEGCKRHGFEWCIYPDTEYYIKPPNNFDTYEEAELACLKKLIEIVKN